MTRGKRLYFILVALCLLGLSIAGPVDRLSDRYTDQALSNAAVTFAVARVMNGVISVIQGTRLSATPAGVGVNLAVGEILDPLNDLLEQFSWIMLAATTSLGIQKILLAIGPSLGFNIVLGMSIAYLIVALWSKSRLIRPQTALKLVLLVATLRFAMALVVLANQWVFYAFMQDDYQTSAASLEQASAEMERLNLDLPGEGSSQSGQVIPGDGEPDAGRQASLAGRKAKAQAAEDEGWFAAIKRLFSDTVEVMNPADRIEEIKQASAEMMNHIFKLSAIFVLQTIIIPIAFLWGIYRFCLWLIRLDFEQRGRALFRD
jgi:hypothetical protein